MVVLLEVAERTGTSLGQALATGEMESAHTWNDHVRPTLQNGDLGSATGVWQFIPSTFHRIIRMFGTQLLAASAANAAAGREPMDLGEGPFTDAKVRSLIQETVDGKRGAKDEELQLLRHNFAVLAFAKHYLSVESGAATPEEDYLFHFLGEGLGRRVLSLARGEARHTLCVKAVEPPAAPVDQEPGLLAGEAAKAPLTAPVDQPAAPPTPAVAPVAKTETASTRSRTAPQVTTPVSYKRTVVTQSLPGATPPTPAPAPNKKSPTDLASPRPASATKPGVSPAVAALGRRPDASSWWLKTSIEVLKGEDPSALVRGKNLKQVAPAVAAQPAIASPAIASMVYADAPPPVSSEWGLPANSPTVTGNLGMFYRDGRGRSQPYTWTEFMQHLAKRVRANNQPELVRAKYGVGFPLKGGDVPERTFKPEQLDAAAEFRHDNDLRVLLPELLVTGTLTPQETQQYKRRLIELVRQGEDRPLDTLPPEILSALHHLRLLPPKVQDVSTTNPQVQKALQAFRIRIGKDVPDDPAHQHLLMPAERIALELYAQRLDRYAAMQAGQVASLSDAPDLQRIRKMPTGLQKAAAPHIAALQTALAGRGLLSFPTQKIVWRDKKKKRHEEYKTAAFAGKADQSTVAALSNFQYRHGLRRTEGVLDTVTLNLLGLPPIGQELFSPLSGPQCAFEGWAETPPRSEVPSERQRPADGIQIPHLLPGANRGVNGSVALLMSIRPRGPDAFSPLSGPLCAFNGWAETLPMSEVPAEDGAVCSAQNAPTLTRRLTPPTLSIQSALPPKGDPG